jgi:enamine deaminase RidA (YjgF/YER057c/UK114 family)
VSPEKTLEKLGYKIGPVDVDNGKFGQAVRAGGFVYTAGQVSTWDGRDIKGKVGGDLTVQQGYEAARLCTLNNLSAIRSVVDSLDQVARIVKVLGMVNVAPGFDNTPGVINGCSDLLREVFGAEKGLHSRSAVGVTLPFNWAVEIEMVVLLG